MPELDDKGSNGRRILSMTLAGLGMVMTAGATAGYLAEHKAQGGGPLETAGVIAMTAFAAIIVGLGYTIWCNIRTLKHRGDDLTRREKLNRNIMLACGLLGGATGAVLAATSNFDMTAPASGTFSVSGDGSLPIAIALLLVFVWGVIMPMVAWVWHTRAIDELEASAYRDGGYYAAYAYLIVAPVWWLLWRGGLLPEPNGVAIFFAFTLIWSAVWFWKKYR
jgi:hypothetical protein